MAVIAPFVPLILSGLSTAAGAVGTGMQFAAQGAAGDAARKEAEHNARISEVAAKDAEARGEIEAAKSRMMGTRVVAEQRAAYGASGVDVDSGTPLDVAAETRANSELDALTAKVNAAREAWGYRNKAQGILREGAATASAAAQSQLGTFLAGAGDLAKNVVGTYRTGKEVPDEAWKRLWGSK